MFLLQLAINGFVRVHKFSNDHVTGNPTMTRKKFYSLIISLEETVVKRNIVIIIIVLFRMTERRFINMSKDYLTQICLINVRSSGSEYNSVDSFCVYIKI